MSRKAARRRERSKPREEPEGLLTRAGGWLRTGKDTVGALLSPLFPPREVWRKALPAFGWAALAAVLLRLAYQPINLSPVAFVALVPLFWGLRTLRPGMAFWPALLFGSMTAFFMTYWLVSVSRFNPLVWIGIVPLAVWMGAHAAVALSAIVYFARNLPPWGALAAAMLAWAGMEYFKMIGRLGSPYGLLGHSQAGWLQMAQIVSLGGVPLLSALIIGTNLSVMETIAAFRARYGHAGALSRLALFVVLIVWAAVWGGRTMADTDSRLEGEGAFPARLALIQSNIPQELKFASYADPDPEVRHENQVEITGRHFAMLDQIEPRQADLIIFAESPFTQDFIDVERHYQYEIHGYVVFDRVREYADDLGIPIVVGGADNVFATPDGEKTQLLAEGHNPMSGEFYPGYHAYNALWVVRPDEEGIPYTADYRKIQLMPFGEEVPYFDLIPGFQEHVVQVGTFARGSRRQQPIGVAIPDPAVEEPPEMRLGPSICYEGLFPGLHRALARRGANLFVNVTNDAWFEGSEGKAWHKDMTRWRSIETRLPMARANNTGITCIYNGTGRTVEEIPGGEEGILFAEVMLQEDPPLTLYSRIGDVPGWGGLLGALVWLGYLKRREWAEARETD